MATTAEEWATEKAALLATIKQHIEDHKTMSATALAKMRESRKECHDVTSERDALLALLERLACQLSDALPPRDDDAAHDEDTIETQLATLIADHKKMQDFMLVAASASSSSISSSSTAGGSGAGKRGKRKATGGDKENNNDNNNNAEYAGADDAEGHTSKKGRAAATWVAFLTDDPDPHKKWGCACKRADCKEEIHYSDGEKSAYNKAHHCATKKK